MKNTLKLKEIASIVYTCDDQVMDAVFKEVLATDRALWTTKLVLDLIHKFNTLKEEGKL